MAFQRKIMLLLIFVAEVYDSNLNPDAFLRHISKLYEKIINIMAIHLLLKETSNNMMMILFS